jgi:uncharacterized membrane protein
LETWEWKSERNSENSQDVSKEDYKDGERVWRTEEGKYRIELKVSNKVCRDCLYEEEIGTVV